MNFPLSTLLQQREPAVNELNATQNTFRYWCIIRFYAFTLSRFCNATFLKTAV